ncbi:putative glycolipid-binding domain-containing protein [Pedobacter sp. SYP-B3415]|uniref:putative glycolipid-binding domain-containing protein n=1 Tax=Pedobacter sp. SYP-B3415 TaxID=2496641 RepID=UPI00101D23F8|nr:putative glycolipid-binding domain-containing protein [Pedobacter sp. SYP-B3415]
MKTNLLWTGREYYSLEHCRVDVNEAGATVQSTIVGYYENEIHQANYRILTNSEWQTRSAEIELYHRRRKRSFSVQKEDDGQWQCDAMHAPQFAGCTEVDIAITPFTNTLPIRRLGLSIGQDAEIRVIYFDLLSNEIRPVSQRYTRLSENTYRYENIPNDFEAVIEVDDQGLVVDYPGLFVRTAVQQG